MNMRAAWRRLGVLIALAAAGAASAEPVPAPAPAPEAATAAPVAPERVVEAFHKALQENFQQGVIDQLAEDVLIFEQGYVERSREEYAGSHLHNDMKFAAATRRTVMGRDAMQDRDLAYVITQSITEGRFGDQDIALDNTETMVLRRDGPSWKITHIHWSAHPRAARAAAPAAPAAPVAPARDGAAPTTPPAPGVPAPTPATPPAPAAGQPPATNPAAPAVPPPKPE